MRRTATLFFVVALAIPFVAAADACPVTSKNPCLDETVLFDTKSGTCPRILKGHELLNCRCRRTVNNGKAIYSGGAYVTVKEDGYIKKRINKCDPASQRISGPETSSSDGEIDPTDLLSTRISVESLDTTSSTDRDELARVLQGMEVPGVTPELVHNNPDAAKDLALKILDNDQEGAKAAARELGLNEDLGDVKRLQANAIGSANKEDTAADSIYTRDTFGSTSSGEDCDELCKDAKVIRYMESSGRYGITTCARGKCVYGAYQVLGSNVWAWTCEVGQCATSEQFLRDPDLQDRVFRNKFGQYKDQFGSGTAAAQAWFGGPGSVGKYGRSDALGTTVGAYAAKYARLRGDPDFNYNVADYTVRGGSSPFGNVNPFFIRKPGRISSSHGGFERRRVSVRCWCLSAPAINARSTIIAPAGFFSTLASRRAGNCADFRKYSDTRHASSTCRLDHRTAPRSFEGEHAPRLVVDDRDESIESLPGVPACGSD